MTSFAALSARQVMHPDPVCARPEQTLVELRQLLVASHVTGAPVVEHGKLVGVISRSDLARVEELMTVLDSAVNAESGYLEHEADGFSHGSRAAYDGFRRRVTDLRVRDAMRTQVISCQPDSPIVDVAREMIEQRVHRIIVVEGQRPVGIISALDIVRLVADA